MSELKHTPGPWHRNVPPAAHYTTIFAGRNTHVAVVCSGPPLTAEEVEANCNLLAAAPELLAACEAALEIIDHRDNLQFMACASTLKAAIAKATS